MGNGLARISHQEFFLKQGEAVGKSSPENSLLFFLKTKILIQLFTLQQVI